VNECKPLVGGGGGGGGGDLGGGGGGSGGGGGGGGGGMLAAASPRGGGGGGAAADGHIPRTAVQCWDWQTRGRTCTWGNACHFAHTGGGGSGSGVGVSGMGGGGRGGSGSGVGGGSSVVGGGVDEKTKRIKVLAQKRKQEETPAQPIATMTQPESEEEFLRAFRAFKALMGQGCHDALKAVRTTEGGLKVHRANQLGCTRGEIEGRGLHPSPSQLNLSHF